ncbi:MAG: TlpA family protein disulfide reductase, partial [Planctomycetes bacterium]|nr:TlpA family protein disulfide reductase [Planctomycetota bacterium]
MKALPSIQKFYEANKDRGLHVFLVNAQAEPKGGMQKFADDRGLTFPIPMARGGFDNYPVSGLPTVYVIGPDGKIVSDSRKGYMAECTKQLDRIKYLGLGKLDVVKDCVKAATEFSKGNFAKAKATAEKVKEKKADDEATVADAEYIIDRVNKMAEGLQAKAEVKKEERRYHEMVAILEQIAGKGFKGMECADDAAEQLKAIKKDKAIGTEIKAWNALAKVVEANKKAKDAATKKKNLFKF